MRAALRRGCAGGGDVRSGGGGVQLLAGRTRPARPAASRGSRFGYTRTGTRPRRGITKIIAARGRAAARRAAQHRPYPPQNPYALRVICREAGGAAVQVGSRYPAGECGAFWQVAPSPKMAAPVDDRMRTLRSAKRHPLYCSNDRDDLGKLV